MAPGPSLDALRGAGDATALPHDDCYWVWPGRFLAGAHPAFHVDALIAAGVDTFIDLTQSRASAASYADRLGARSRRLGFAIADYGVPGRELMREVVDAIDAELARGARLYLHCHAGVGRTGTALGCWLVERGFAPADALALIALKRSHLRTLHVAPQSPETAAQRDFVLRWQPRAR